MEAPGRMSPELLPVVQEAIAVLESWRGQLVRVDVALARGNYEEWEYDRHSSTHSHLAFVVTHVGWRFSGSALWVLGEMVDCDCGHEVSMDALTAVHRLDDGSLAFKERFGRTAERVSVFRLDVSK
jgi:hypothetical protein